MTTTYDKVIQLANTLQAEGKYDSTYSAVLAIYQELTGDTETKFDSTYSIVATIADGVESGDIDLGGDCPEFITQIFKQTITENGHYNYVPASDGYSQVDLTVDVEIPEFTTQTLTETITTNGTYNYIPDTDGYSQVDITVNVEGGGSDDSDFDGSPKIRFFTGAGLLVEEWDFETAKTKTELPAFHTIEPLLTQTGWNADFDDINWAIEHNTDLAVGALYRPNDNKTHIFVDIKPENLNTVLFIQMLDGFEIDWGDGVIEDVDTINGYPQHTYTTAGSKEIKISGNWLPQWGVSSLSMTAKDYNGFQNSYYFKQITHIFCGVKLNYYWFKYLSNLKYLTFVEDEVVYSQSNFNFTECDNLVAISLPKGRNNILLGNLGNCNIEVICNPVDLNVGTSLNFGSSSIHQSRLKYINIPNSVTSTGSDAFYNCHLLKSINIPNTVTSIGGGAFSYCSSLTSITIPNSVTSIGGSAFAGCHSLKSINIPDGITSIGNSTFNGCYLLQSINVPDGVTTIGDNAFQNCYSLQSINIPDSVTTIGDVVFYNCYLLQSITIPNSVTSAGQLFSGCNSLKSINISDNITSIARGSFSDCYSLQSINIPDSVTSIDNYAFEDCYSLQSVNIPDSVTSLGDSIFSNCTSLQSITISNNVTSIGRYTFYKCKYITVDFSENTQIPELSSTTAFDSTAIILVPSALYDEWIASTNWSSLTDRIVAV